MYQNHLRRRPSCQEGIRVPWGCSSTVLVSHLPRTLPVLVAVPDGPLAHHACTAVLRVGMETLWQGSQAWGFRPLFSLCHTRRHTRRHFRKSPRESPAPQSFGLCRWVWHGLVQGLSPERPGGRLLLPPGARAPLAYPCGAGFLPSSMARDLSVIPRQPRALPRRRGVKPRSRNRIPK